uniref:Tissue factor pathway inhibitor n=1 Tax=Esox lucius TaxID=8010 RepID=A0A3P8YX10_ESOLU
MELGLLISVILSCSLSCVFALLPKEEVCLLQVDEGSCRGNIQRYYYNTVTQQCEEFSYGGCQGNANNFMSFEACQKTCFRIPKIPQICRFPRDVGPCRGSFQKYFFNMTTMQCELFSYGGCKGNENRFDNQASCMEYCRPQKTLPVLCSDHLDKGGCSASIPRYYYNASSKMCEQFIYSGCGGSSNNFVSRQSCMDVCAKAGKLWKTKNPVTKTAMMKIPKKRSRTFAAGSVPA